MIFHVLKLTDKLPVESRLDIVQIPESTIIIDGVTKSRMFPLQTDSIQYQLLV